MHILARWITAFTLALTTCLAAGCVRDQDEFSQESWEALGMGIEPEAFEERLSGLETVRIDPPPVIGEGYSPPEFPPDIEFEPEEWSTNVHGESIAMAGEAKKGGILRLGWSSWPPTIRTDGPNSRLSILSDLQEMVYESMLDYDPVRAEYVPILATHWQIDEDGQTFRFRLDPKARWADGRPVTADDIAATFDHRKNPDRRDPASSQYWSNLVETVEILDRHTVEIRSPERQWRNFLVIALSHIYPASYIRMDGQTYLEDWSWRLPPGTGPYEIRPGDIRKGHSVTLRRRADWWQADLPHTQGKYNFDEVRFIVVRELELMLQRFYAGELDVFPVSRAQQWVDELPQHRLVRNGWIQMRKVFTLKPEGYGGFCFNMRQPPFDDVKIRQAFAHLFNREQLFRSFFSYQYEHTDSYFRGQEGARPGAEPIRFDPSKARELLAEAGYVERDSQGRLVHEDGSRFPTLTLEYSAQGFTRIFRVVQNDLWNEAGIEMDLQVLDYSTILRKVWEHRFQIVFWNWTASLFPDMHFQFHSEFAEQRQSNNISGFADPEADRIMEAYQREFDPDERRRMLQELDQIIFDSHPYALSWYAPYFRVIYWDRFGHPPEYSSRYGDYPLDIITYWWADSEREARTQANMGEGQPNYPDKPLSQSSEREPRYWLDNELPRPNVPGREPTQ